MGTHVSKTVQKEIGRMYAKMASAAAKVAIHQAGSSFASIRKEADETAAAAERWLRKAGADATRWYFSI